jgi:hypothetical protein
MDVLFSHVRGLTPGMSPSAVAELRGGRWSVDRGKQTWLSRARPGSDPGHDHRRQGRKGRGWRIAG